MSLLAVLDQSAIHLLILWGEVPGWGQLFLNILLPVVLMGIAFLTESPLLGALGSALACLGVFSSLGDGAAEGAAYYHFGMLLSAASAVGMGLAVAGSRSTPKNPST
jgi:uncharacterized membrane protein YccC